MSTINLALSSPSLTTKALAASKAYLFLMSSSKSTRERIIGCIIAQNIETAMKIVWDSTNGKGLVQVDQGVYCECVSIRQPTIPTNSHSAPLLYPLRLVSPEYLSRRTVVGWASRNHFSTPLPARSYMVAFLTHPKVRWPFHNQLAMVRD